MRTALTALILVLAPACKQKANFSADNSNGFKPAAGGSPDDPCGAAGVTNATLITPTVENGVQGNYLEYEVSLADCEGKPKPFTANRILFDVDAQLRGPKVNAPLSYRVESKLGSLAGSLDNKQGNDLFGRSGANLFYYATDRAIQFPTDAGAVKLRIDLAGHSMRPTTKGASSPDQLATYLRIGDARSVQMIVTLINH